jgi:hypothetical protein
MICMAPTTVFDLFIKSRAGTIHITTRLSSCLLWKQAFVCFALFCFCARQACWTHQINTRVWNTLHRVRSMSKDGLCRINNVTVGDRIYNSKARRSLFHNMTVLNINRRIGDAMWIIFSYSMVSVKHEVHFVYD